MHGQFYYGDGNFEIRWTVRKSHELNWISNKEIITVKFYA